MLCDFEIGNNNGDLKVARLVRKSLVMLIVSSSNALLKIYTLQENFDLGSEYTLIY